LAGAIWYRRHRRYDATTRHDDDDDDSPLGAFNPAGVRGY
jgi:hypothetical protein